MSKPMGKTIEQEKGEPEHKIIKEDSMKGSMHHPPISLSIERQKEGF